MICSFLRSKKKKINGKYLFVLYFYDADNLGAEIAEIVWKFTRYRDYSNHIARTGLHEFMCQSGSVRFSIGQFPQGIPKSK